MHRFTIAFAGDIADWNSMTFDNYSEVYGRVADPWFEYGCWFD